MALTATVYNFEISLSNVDTSVYEEVSLPIARHPSESMQYLLTRLLAYCLEYRPGITFTRGLSEPDEPAVWAHDLTGRLTLWVEVGRPKAERLHRASKSGAEVAVYLYSDSRSFMEGLKGERIHNASKLRVYALDPVSLTKLESFITRRTALSISISEGQVYISSPGGQLEFPIERLGIGEEI